MPVSVTFLKGVKASRAESLERLGVRTLEDLALLCPRSYENRALICSIANATVGSECSVRGVISNVEYKRIRNNLSVINVDLSDDSGSIRLVFYNQDYLRTKLRHDMSVTVYGAVSRGFYGVEMTNPVYTDKPDDVEFLAITPVYPLTKGLSQNILRKLVRSALDLLPPFPDNLPRELLDKYDLPTADEAVRSLHAPKTLAEAEAARRRLAFDELFNIQLMLMLTRLSYGDNISGISYKISPRIAELIASLPFTLSESQQRVWAEITADMESSRPMNRLVLGDVGSGKTILAVLAMFNAVDNGYQAVYMAPTEILAEQHYTNIAPIMERFGISCGLLTGSVTASARRELLERISNGSLQCIIGTHALIQNSVSYARPGIVITDEQHRFGVRQRAMLAMQETRPDILVMTATPIPRTLGLILYGDMDISRIDSLPHGRMPIITYVENDRRRERIYNWARKLASEGQQVYIVCPLVEDNDYAADQNLKSATSHYNKLSKSVFKGVKCGLLHGKMPSRDKESVMRAFSEGELQILFATTVIEVGVDVPNATLMIVENAERFGLAQLHQLRGRVGRGSLQSYCVLFVGSAPERVGEQTESAAGFAVAVVAENDITMQRMQIMKQTTNGFLIAEKDLELRGPGDFFGTNQHGLPQFKIANLYQDTDILRMAQEAAQSAVADPVTYKSAIDAAMALIPENPVL